MRPGLGEIRKFVTFDALLADSHGVGLDAELSARRL
jgi:hypothetical protein